MPQQPDLNADLHCHSVFSDGVLTPEELAARARTSGVQLWALSDHDEIAGQDRAVAAAAALGLDCLSGVEISVTFIERTVHIVGLGFDQHDDALLQGLACVRGGRDQRAHAIAARLEALGIPDTYEGALAFVSNSSLISRAHFARHLVRSGVCRDMPEVFHKYLGDNKPANVPHQWATLRQAVQWITGAGGEAVIAHPARYQFTANEEYALFGEFAAIGGRGVEVITSNHTVAEAAKYADMAREFGLAASRGSDFHSPTESRVALGQLPPLPAGVTPIWELLDDRILRAAPAD